MPDQVNLPERLYRAIHEKDYQNALLLAGTLAVAVFLGCRSIRPRLASASPPSRIDSDAIQLARKARRTRRAAEKAAFAKVKPSHTSSHTKEFPAESVATPFRPSVKQPYDAFLVLDVEGTCEAGSSMDWPNEIIEWPVCLMRWKSVNGLNLLEIVDEYRSYVKPTWRPQLTEFCTNLTGITQAQVDQASLFPEVLDSFAQFLVKHGLIDASTGQRLLRFCWCSDGPYDVRDFVAKQCFLSQMTTPEWLKGDVIDVSLMVSRLLDRQSPKKKKRSRIKLKIPTQLSALDLTPFEGRAHCGIDDARNIARVLAELARRNVSLVPNIRIIPGKRWPWMGEPGEVIEGNVGPSSASFDISTVRS